MTTLKAADVASRGILRQILHLPKDVRTAMFHASIADGVLGIPSLYARVPLIRKARISNLRNDNHPIFNSLVNENFVTTYLDRYTPPKIKILFRLLRPFGPKPYTLHVMAEVWRSHAMAASLQPLLA